MKPWIHLVLFLVCACLRAEDQPRYLASGPLQDTSLSAIQCYGVVGPHTGSQFDLAAHVGMAPCGFLFIHELNRNTAPVIRGFDQMGGLYSVLGVRLYTILLGQDRTADEQKLKSVNGSLRLREPILLNVDGPEGPGNYALNRKSTLTLVFANQGKVTRSFGITDAGQHDLPAIEKAIQDMVGILPDDPQDLKEFLWDRLPQDPQSLKALLLAQTLEIRRLTAAFQRQDGSGRMASPGMMRRPKEDESTPSAEPAATPGAAQDKPSGESERPAPQRKGQPPVDPQLNSLLRSLIRKTQTPEQIDTIISSIQERSTKSDDLKDQTIQMFQLMLSFRDRYGSEYAQEKAEKLLQQLESK